MTLSKITLANLAAMPDRLTEAFRLVPERYQTWIPLSWDGIPGERFSPLGQLCHVRDIEVYGYHVRIARMLAEEKPALVSLDSYQLASERNYETADAEEALVAFRVARGVTVRTLKGVTAEQLERGGTFGKYGRITLRSLTISPAMTSNTWRALNGCWVKYTRPEAQKPDAIRIATIG